jgi:CRISPR-associated protein Cas2
MRRLYLVTYDICGPRRLRKVFKTMQAFGEHLQLSVFQCDLTPIGRIEMHAELQKIIDPKEDRVLIIDLGASDPYPVKSFEMLGKKVEMARRASVIV